HRAINSGSRVRILRQSPIAVRPSEVEAAFRPPSRACPSGRGRRQAHKGVLRTADTGVAQTCRTHGVGRVSSSAPRPRCGGAAFCLRGLLFLVLSEGGVPCGLWFVV